MKIFIVCPRLCHGGAERVAVSLANGFAGRKHEVFFFTDLFEEQTYQLEEAVHLVNMIAVPHPKWRKWYSAVKNLRKYIRRERPDVIIGIMSLCSLVARIATIGTSIPVIATEHDSYERPSSAPMPFLIHFYKFYLSKIFDIVTVLTEADKKLLGKRKKSIVVMPNPLALEPIKERPYKENIILASGRVDNWHYKGFDVLIKAWGKIINKEGWRLRIAGVWRNPETRVFLDGIAEESGVKDKIEYTGFVSDMQALYANASIFVLSSRYEAFGLVLIEAMSQGCACIACDYKGRQREIIQDDLQGLCCEPDNVDALADALGKMITDEEYRESVRKNAIERSKYYSIENTMNRWEELLSQVV